MTDETLPHDPPLVVGQEFVRFEIRSLIGQGDHAFVYDAYDPLLERTVAIKIIPDPPNSKRDLVQRSIEQSAILRDLNHPNLVSVFDVGTIGDDLVYVVMERLEGKTLRELLNERGLLSPLEVTNIGIRVAEGLAFAHGRLVIHRDVKPENIFILSSGSIKVINTGITSFIVPSGMVTERDRLRGTLTYMSPEHIQGFGVTESCDIYSLGTVLYECLAGSPPVLIGSENLTLEDVTWRQVAHMPPQLDALIPETPKYLAHAIQQMLAKEVVLRVTNMDAVAARLREAQRQIREQAEPAPATAAPISLAPNQIAERAAVLDDGDNSRCPPIEASDPPQATARHRMRLLMLAIATGAIAGIVIAYFKVDVSAQRDDKAPLTRANQSIRPELSTGTETENNSHTGTTSGPMAAAGGPTESQILENTKSYDAGAPPSATRLSTSSRVVIKPVNPQLRARKRSSPSSSGLIF